MTTGMDEPGTTTEPDADLRSSAHHKALRINLEPGKYGTFAEIGAGQEVVAWFIRVGGASRTLPGC
jgi:hypothetical protein